MGTRPTAEAHGTPALAAGVIARNLDGPGSYRDRMDDGLSDSELDEIEARVLAATAGPWKAFVEGRDHLGGDNFIRTGGLDDRGPDMYVELAFSDQSGLLPAPPADLDFIANARQDVPRLMKELRRLRRGEDGVEV